MEFQENMKQAHNTAVPARAGVLLSEVVAPRPRG